jgi:hypothetical protein
MSLYYKSLESRLRNESKQKKLEQLAQAKQILEQELAAMTEEQKLARMEQYKAFAKVIAGELKTPVGKPKDVKVAVPKPAVVKPASLQKETSDILNLKKIKPELRDAVVPIGVKTRNVIPVRPKRGPQPPPGEPPADQAKVRAIRKRLSELPAEFVPERTQVEPTGIFSMRGKRAKLTAKRGALERDLI